MALKKSPYLSILALLALVSLIGILLLQLFSSAQNYTAGSAPAPSMIKLKFGHNIPEDSAMHLAALRFAETVSDKTNGRVEIKIYPAQTLANDHQMVEMARNGELDMLLTPTAKLSVPVPAMQYADLPFLFPSREDAYAMLDGEPGKLLLEKLRPIGLMGVTFWENGFKHFTGNQLYRHPDDFVGKKFRVMKSRIIIEQFESLGAEAVPIDFHTTRSALRDKVVDGQENPLIAIVSMGFHEEQSHFIYSEHAYLGYVFSFSQKTLDRLPQDIVKVLIETAREVTPWQREETQRREAELLKIIEQAGVEIYRLTPEEKQAFAEKTAHIIRIFEPIIGSNIISKTQFYLNNKYLLNQPNMATIGIGLNADLSTGAATAGLAIKRGAEMAMDEINRQGGVLGRKLVLMPMDHRAVSSIGIENIKTLAELPEVAAILGGLHSAVIVDEIDSVQKTKIPYLIPWASASEVTENGYADNYLFRVSINDRLAVNYLTDFALGKVKNPAIVVENSIWGRSNLRRIVERLSQVGAPEPLQIVFNRGQKDFEQEILQLTASQSDGVILVANSVEGTEIIRTLSSQSSRVMPIISHWGLAGGHFFEKQSSLDKNLELYLLQTFSFDGELNPRAQRLKQTFLQNYEQSGPIYAANGVAQAYDLVQLLALAINQTGSVDRIQIKHELENLPAYQGVLKHYQPAFNAKSHDALRYEDFYFAKWTEYGLQRVRE